MGILRDWNQITVKDFRGPWLIIEPGDIPLTNAQLAQNVDYLPGLVKTRLGFKPVQTPGDKIVSMVNWLSPSFTGITSYLAYLATAGAHPGMNLMTLPTGSVQSLYTPVGNPVGAVFAFGGYRLFMVTYNAQGVGSDQGRVFSQATVATFDAGTDPLFLGPLPFSPTVSDTITPGIVTPGVHQIGYLLTTRNGFTTIPSPQSTITGKFVPVSWTAAGGHQLAISINPAPDTWPAAYETLQIIMTQAGGAQFFFVPGATAQVPFGSGTIVNLLVNIDDGTLAADGQDATPFFTKIVQGQNDIAPFFVGTYNSRMYYMALDPLGVNTTYVSNSNDFQTIYEATSVIYLPGQLPVTCGFTLYNTLYLVGPHWTYSTQDNGGDPVTWPGPQLIDGLVGTLSPLGVTVNASQGIAWVADTAGLYLFSGGAYSTRPISYYQDSDWKRINWVGGGRTVQVVDDKANYKVHVLVPLDGATAPNFFMTWDYSRGLDPESVNYSLNSLQGYNAGALTLVQNPTSQLVEEWIAPGDSASNPIMRRATLADLNPFRDNNQPIISTYQTALLPTLSGEVFKHYGDQFRLTGFGNIGLKARSLDGQTEVDLSTVVAEVFPGQIYLRMYELLSEAASIQVTTSDLDAWFQLSEIQHYFKPYVTHR